MRTYPFSLANHGHDIEFRYNRLRNMESDYFAGDLQLTSAEFERLEEELELVTKAYEAILNTFNNGRVVWVDGATLAILKKCVAWATVERDRKNRK